MIHAFDSTTLPATPWKNGGGSTREIVCQPPGAGMDSFDWRISIASIQQDGPFSAFPGVDRVIMLLDGAGVRLQAHGMDHRLDTPHVPFAFSGDAPVDCTLLGGTSRDFNVMTRRGKLRAELQLLDSTAAIAASPQGLLLALHGAWQLQATSSVPQGLHCASGCGLWWDSHASWQATPLHHAARLVVVRLLDL